MYKVDISPAANSVLEEYTFRCAEDNGEECALRLLDAFDDKNNIKGRKFCFEPLPRFYYSRNFSFCSSRNSAVSK